MGASREHVLVVAPHPDDETLGAGGALLRWKAEGRRLTWVTVTAMRPEHGFPAGDCDRRERELERVATAYGFDDRVHLPFAPAGLDTRPLAEVVHALGSVISDLAPDTVILPSGGDAHSDHRVVSRAGLAATKSFRFPSVRRVLAMEVVSETDLGEGGAFSPSYFVDVTAFIDRKVGIMGLYAGEMGSPPFPRSAEALRALATLRGGQCGRRYAEAFHPLRWCE